tara:strand:+ start:1456 stop:1605 length:150 start_codon:yes stop_codon:yes gene_type:complete
MFYKKPMDDKVKTAVIVIIFFILVAIYNIYFGGAGICETKVFWWDRLWC